MKDKNKLVCQFCNVKFESYHSIGSHIFQAHVLSVKDYYDKFFKTKLDGTCVYCQKVETRFAGLRRGYVKFCGNRCVGFKTSKGRVPWNKGLTRLTDTRVEKYSKAREGVKFTEERKWNLRKNHADMSGKNNPMYGKPRPVIFKDTLPERLLQRALIEQDIKFSTHKQIKGTPDNGWINCKDKGFEIHKADAVLKFIREGGKSNESRRF